MAIKSWLVKRDGLDVGEYDSHKQAQRIIKALQRAFPASNFQAIYRGSGVSYVDNGRGRAQ